MKEVYDLFQQFFSNNFPINKIVDIYVDLQKTLLLIVTSPLTTKHTIDQHSPKHSRKNIWVLTKNLRFSLFYIYIII